ncbi:MAG: hypothetical protein IT290_00550, partial [Deltaproteobacteria bacterium]|nr:hypothetical protein [Deltaproteobacteria bacterium]
MLREMQVRLVYSLLKPAAAFAAAFGIPIKSLVDLFRLAYFEHLAKQGRTQKEIAEYFGQSDRHIRSLAQRLKTDFFASEREVGLTREMEEYIAAKKPTAAQILRKFSVWEESSIQAALNRLLEQGRIHQTDERFSITTRYTVLQSDQFQNRIDALN